ncbi:hypothetical protein [Burkholderia savannae]|uniref:hypothetical protein n=1 Tax=Burkholderia savannae TaxID=1637837 RepID=UPI0012E3A6B4|nr:hypothetical protein [Burkholderia savannae]
MRDPHIGGLRDAQHAMRTRRRAAPLPLGIVGEAPGARARRAIRPLRFPFRFPLSASLRTSLPIARVTPFERASADRLDRGSSRQRAAISQPRAALDRFGARRRVADRIRQPPNRRIAPIRTAGEGRPRANSTVFSFGDVGKRLSTRTLNRQTIANELNRESTYLINTNVQFNCQINSNS